MAENMDLFSLEDEDCSELFITQEPKENLVGLMNENVENMEVNDDSFLGLEKTNFSSPCVSLVSKDSIYSDISDAEDTSFSSQNYQKG